MLRNFAGIILSAAALAGCCVSPPPPIETCEPGAECAPIEEVEPETLRDTPGEFDVFQPACLHAPLDACIRPGRTRDVQVLVEQRGYPVPLYFCVQGLPPGVLLRGRPWISAEGDRTLLVLDAAPAAPLTGRRPVRIVAMGADGRVQGSRIFYLTVGPPS